MAYAWQWLRSLVFIVQMYLAMLVLGIFFAPLSAYDRKYAFAAVHTYCRYVRWSAAVLTGLRSEIRGEVPQDEVLVASKHQSFFDIILLVSVLPRPKFIMKAELRRAPILGWFAQRIGCVPVNRGKRAAAIRAMKESVAQGRIEPGQLVIYPQGTRVAAGAALPYKVGVGILYEQLGQTCVPAATNVGVFWPRHGIYRKPGLAVVEFLDPVAPGLPASQLMRVLEHRIETASNRLMIEGGFDPAKLPDPAEVPVKTAPGEIAR